MNSGYTVAELVPHAGKMSLLGDITDYGGGWLGAQVHINADSMFATDKGVPAWVGLEYMAQAIAAYAGLQERRNGGEPKIGFLLGTRKYMSNIDYFGIGLTLLIKVHLEMKADNGLEVFNCELHGQGVVASATINVFQPEDAEKFLQGANT